MSDEVAERVDNITNRLFSVGFECVLNFPKPNSFGDVLIINRSIGAKCNFFLSLEKKFVTSNKTLIIKNGLNINMTLK